MAGAIEATFHLHINLQALVTILKYPVIWLMLTVLALALYLLTPEIFQTVRQALPGALFFSSIWLASTALFSFYVKHSRYSETYLGLASVIVLLTWTWVTCLLLLLGGRLNAVIVRKWPTRPSAHRGPHLLLGVGGHEGAAASPASRDGGGGATQRCGATAGGPTRRWQRNLHRGG